MDDKFLREIRESLISERTRLADELEEMERAGAENQSDASGENNYRDHMADQGSATFARELDMTFIDASRKSLEDADRAVSRLDDGTYGTCSRCGGAIPESRLRAVPTADLCITCKEWEERS